MSASLPEPGLWRVADVARFLSMSVSWVYKETEAGRLPCVRIGAALRFSPEQIRRYLANLERGRVLSLPRRREPTESTTATCEHASE